MHADVPNAHPAAVANDVGGFLLWRSPDGVFGNQPGRCRHAVPRREEESDWPALGRFWPACARGASPPRPPPRAPVRSRSTHRPRPCRGRPACGRRRPRATAGIDQARRDCPNGTARPGADTRQGAPRPRARKKGGAAASRRYNSISPSKERGMSRRLAGAVVALIFAGSAAAGFWLSATSRRQSDGAEKVSRSRSDRGAEQRAQAAREGRPDRAEEPEAGAQGIRGGAQGFSDGGPPRLTITARTMAPATRCESSAITSAHSRATNAR